MVVTAPVAAATKLRNLLAFIGLLSILGIDWTLWSRIVVGLSLAIAVAIAVTADGHRIRPAKTRSYDITA